ncbi:MAG: hypothetical protein QM538_05645 [Methylacidiphilales bacterium]|nr:hypothetical protein [Candidatus Methylacidiphilales bacterium]
MKYSVVKILTTYQRISSVVIACCFCFFALIIFAPSYAETQSLQGYQQKPEWVSTPTSFTGLKENQLPLADCVTYSGDTSIDRSELRTVLVQSFLENYQQSITSATTSEQAKVAITTNAEKVAASKKVLKNESETITAGEVQGLYLKQTGIFLDQDGTSIVFCGIAIISKISIEKFYDSNAKEAGANIKDLAYITGREAQIQELFNILGIAYDE